MVVAVVVIGCFAWTWSGVEGFTGHFLSRALSCAARLHQVWANITEHDERHSEGADC